MDEQTEKYTLSEGYQNGAFELNGDKTKSRQMQIKQYSSKAIPELDNIEDEPPVSLSQYLKSIFIMPRSMRILALTNLFCWMGHITYCLYFTDFVGEAVFNGDPTVSSALSFFFFNNY